MGFVKTLEVFRIEILLACQPWQKDVRRSDALIAEIRITSTFRLTTFRLEKPLLLQLKQLTLI